MAGKWEVLQHFDPLFPHCRNLIPFFFFFILLYLCILFLSAYDTKTKTHLPSLKVNSVVFSIWAGRWRYNLRSSQVLNWSEIINKEQLLKEQQLS